MPRPQAETRQSDALSKNIPFHQRTFHFRVMAERWAVGHQGLWLTSEEGSKTDLSARSTTGCPGVGNVGAAPLPPDYTSPVSHRPMFAWPGASPCIHFGGGRRGLSYAGLPLERNERRIPRSASAVYAVRCGEGPEKPPALCALST
jgi:hypothetical protein